MTEIVFEGKTVSLNNFYSQKHWTYRKKMRDDFEGKFRDIIKKSDLQPMKRFKIDMVYNSRHDPDNTIIMLKMFVDTMRHLNIIEDDTKKYFRGFSVTPDARLKKDTIIFKVHGLN